MYVDGSSVSTTVYLCANRRNPGLAPAVGDHELGWDIDNLSLLETTMRKISYATALVAVAVNLVIVRPVSLVFVTWSYNLLARA